MDGDGCHVSLSLTREEADEILSRCLSSRERDNPAFQQAVMKLARAIFANDDRQESAAA